MNRLGNGWTRSMRVVLLGALALLLVAPATYGAAKVTVDAKVIGTPGFGAQLRGEVTIKINDGSSLRSVTWSQLSGAAARLTPLPGATHPVRIRLNKEPAYRSELIHVLLEPPVEPGPPNLPFEQEFSGGLQNRWQVVALNPFTLEETGLVVLQVTVLTSSGTYTDTVDIGIDLTQRRSGYEPLAVTTGLTNVPVKQLVQLYGKTQASYNWSLAAKPFASDATLKGATSQAPYFLPDAPGTYLIRVTDLATGQPVTLTIYAGTWRGVIVAQDSHGDPVGDPACVNCHNGTLAPDLFTPWAQTGHAKIFTDNINTSDHYGTSCFSCHTVGYDPLRVNKGLDEASDYAAFLASDLLHGADPGNWTMMLGQYPQTAKLANIQCENCHGPQVIANDTSPAHGLSDPLPVGEPRVSFSSELCATCHGEPLRHARYQQWQISGHGNYELAEDEGTRGSCARCHTANGFMKWVPALLDADPTNDTKDIVIDWDPDESLPQTCITCHDPHDVGATTGDTTDAPVRISGNTANLDAGFKAVAVGKGAICITCHNSRRGLRNDYVTFDKADADRATHLGPQGDVVMGQNAYFMANVGVRGRHSFVEDTCVKCHMEVSPPPAALAYNLGGTNHTFFAKADICNECHTGADVGNLQHGFEAMLEGLAEDLLEKIEAVMTDQISQGNKIRIGTSASSPTITDMATVAKIELYEGSGRQGIRVTLTNGTVIPGTRMNSVFVVKPDGTAVTFYTVSGYDLAKAGWNYWLLHSDLSKGAHNPTWVFEVINASTRALGSERAPVLSASDLVVGMNMK